MKLTEWKHFAQPLKRKFARRALILQYHRVADVPFDPYLVTVTPKHFAEHLSVLRKVARPVSLAKVFSELSVMKRLPVVVTFDDGYYDLLSHAKPLLERYETPATIFVTSGFVGAQREFWWDALAKILLEPGTLPAELSLSLMEHDFQWRLDEASVYSQEQFQQHRNWNYGAKLDPTLRHRVFRTLYGLLQPLSDKEKRCAIDRLALWAGIKLEVRPSHRSLSTDELVQLASVDTIEIGAHTITHPVLSQIAREAQRQEIQGSKTDLEHMVGRRIHSFSYPHGLSYHYTDESVSLVRVAGYQLACSSSAGFVSLHNDPLQMPRFIVSDCNGDQFAKQLTDWRS